MINLAKTQFLILGIIVVVIIGLLGASFYFFVYPAFADLDKDGLSKKEELKLGTNPTNPDSDGDGLIDGEEVKNYKSNPLNSDSDSDRLSDGDEVKIYKSSLTKIDTDQDNLNDYQEVIIYKSDPIKEDTDGDGKEDGDEVTQGYDPTIIGETRLGKEAILRILAEAEKIGPVQYEMVVTMVIEAIPGQPVRAGSTGKAWQKDHNVRIEMTTKIEGTTYTTDTTMIIKPDGIYLYDSSRDKYEKITKEEMAEMYQDRSFEELAKEVKESIELKTLGTEIIDSKLATVVEYTLVFKDIVTTSKLWIWNEKGLPLKTVITTPPLVTITMEFKNIIFGDIPDSLFEIPPEKIL